MTMIIMEIEFHGQIILRVKIVEMIAASVDIPYLEYDVAVDVNNHTLDTLLAVGSTPYFF